MRMSLMFLSFVGLFLWMEQTAFAAEHLLKVSANTRPRLVTSCRDCDLEKAAKEAKALEEGVDWSVWHKRIDAAVQEQFELQAGAYFNGSSPHMTKVAYLVTKNGEVRHVHSVGTQSGEVSNVYPDYKKLVFDSFMLASVRSLDGKKALLAFPEGTKRESILKVGEYLHYVHKEATPSSGRREERFQFACVHMFAPEPPRLPRRTQNPFVRPVGSGRILQAEESQWLRH